MTDWTPESEGISGAERRTPRAHYALLGAVCALVIGVYAWSAKSGWVELACLNAENTYYNLLVQGFRSGQIIAAIPNCLPSAKWCVMATVECDPI